MYLRKKPFFEKTQREFLNLWNFLQMIDKSVTIPASAEIFFKDMLKKKSTDEFRKIQRKQKQKEFVRERFEQYFNGVKVEGAGYNFHYKNGKMFITHGHYLNTNNIYL
jgi:bacillolysin